MFTTLCIGTFSARLFLCIIYIYIYIISLIPCKLRRCLNFLKLEFGDLQESTKTSLLHLKNHLKTEQAAIAACLERPGKFPQRKPLQLLSFQLQEEVFQPTLCAVLSQHRSVWEGPNVMSGLSFGRIKICTSECF